MNMPAYDLIKKNAGQNISMMHLKKLNELK